MTGRNSNNNDNNNNNDKVIEISNLPTKSKYKKIFFYKKSIFVFGFFS